MFCNVNIWALLVSTVVSLIVTAIWYSDYVLGKQWRSYITNLFSSAKPSNISIAKMFGVQFVLTLITNFILARALVYTSAFSWSSAFAVAVAVWIGFIAMIEGSAIVWEKKSWKLVAINSGVYLITFIISAIILATWR